LRIGQWQALRQVRPEYPVFGDQILVLQQQLLVHQPRNIRQKTNHFVVDHRERPSSQIKANRRVLVFSLYDIHYTPNLSRNESEEKFSEQFRKTTGARAQARREALDRPIHRTFEAERVSRSEFHKAWTQHVDLLKSMGKLKESPTNAEPPTSIHRASKGWCE
jgi:hypothetical protein